MLTTKYLSPHLDITLVSWYTSGMNDQDNPAVASKIAVPPALLEEISEDPTAAQPVFRAMTMIQAHELFMKREDMTTPQKMALMESLAKMGDMTPKNTAITPTGAGFSVNIVLSAAPQTKPAVIDVTPEK